MSLAGGNYDDQSIRRSIDRITDVHDPRCTGNRIDDVGSIAE